MQCIGEQLLYTTTRIQTKTLNGVGVGTGFFFEYGERIFLVTNKHVIKDAISGFFTVFKTKEIDGEKTAELGSLIKIDFTPNAFKGHPDNEIDIAVANVSGMMNTDQPYIKWVNEELIPDENFMKKFISPIEDVLFIGYPSDIWDTKNGLPIIRKGTTATPYYVDFKGKNNFLIDASVFNGSSGSPVFLYYSGSYSDKYGRMYAGEMLKFLGVIASSYERNQEGEIVNKNIPTNYIPVAITSQMIDLGVVFNSKVVLETIKYYVNTLK